jgi:hypothetical protein
MLGYVTRTPTTLADLLGEQDLQDFAELSRSTARAGASPAPWAAS